ncbi:hypothetical protein CCY01nite_37800 [Chitinophaga cymbidii]|uniref:Uncharacterized protein n=1 Tax=Chitinophaga cymbidii TaxID=1096750 RepID=A0A512RPA1_9BACT|nr:hypothetical protein CCY01nite_37800 [Chitinophaga cymbidii]
MFFLGAREVIAAKTGMTDFQLLTRAAQKVETAIGETGRFAGTAKHTYANNLLTVIKVYTEIEDCNSISML